MKKKYVFILLISFILIGSFIFLLFFHAKTGKNFKIGNNTTSQEIVDFILNISFYEADIEVQVNSNKNNNKYKLKQQYQKPDISIQEVIEPENIKGFKITKKANQLKIENTNLSLSSIFENYDYLSDNVLDLNSFIDNYKIDEKANWKEENGKIIMICHSNQIEKKLSIDNTTAKPIKLEIKDTNKNTSVYILYHEVTIK